MCMYSVHVCVVQEYPIYTRDVFLEIMRKTNLRKESQLEFKEQGELRKNPWSRKERKNE